MDVSKIGFALVFGAGIAYGSYKVLRKFIDNKPPTEWRQVGIISEIFCFPIKSCGPININEIGTSQIGPESGHIRDRVFMVTRLNGDFVTARMYPKMVRIIPKIDGSVMTLSAPDMKPVLIDIVKLYTLERKQIRNWFKDVIDVVDSGDEVAEWMSMYILGQREGLRVVFYPSRDPKPKTESRNRPFEPAGRIDQGALHDETSFMLMNQGSIEELNTKLETPVTALRFRPNFVVNGPAAFEEDNWKWIKVGDETIFKTVQPCTRCIFTTIDPATGEKNTKNQPLKTLQQFRVFKKTGPTPIFGIQLGVREKGKVKMGDAVFVGK